MKKLEELKARLQSVLEEAHELGVVIYVEVCGELFEVNRDEVEMFDESDELSLTMNGD